MSVLTMPMAINSSTDVWDSMMGHLREHAQAQAKLVLDSLQQVVRVDSQAEDGGGDAGELRSLMLRRRALQPPQRGDGGVHGGVAEAVVR